MQSIIKGRGLLAFAACLMIPSASGGHEISSPSVAERMAKAANAFLASLSSEQKQAVSFPFDDSERFDWHYVPRSRSGLPLKEMNDEQRRLAHRFLRAGLSQSGYLKAKTIIELEAVLREIETWNWLGRDPEKYYFSFFGQPSTTGTWGWRVEGHHLSLNITVVSGHLLAAAPRFLGANPAEVKNGPLAGTRPLKKEEDLARELVRSLETELREKAVFSDRAYRDIVTGSDEQVSPMEPAGIAAAELPPRQMDLLVELINEYASTMSHDIARLRMEAIRANGLDRIHFGWAGGLKPGQAHYYRIQGPSFLIEYDNVQNNANHIHTVWRDFNGDFGRDLLREHHREAHSLISPSP